MNKSNGARKRAVFCDRHADTFLLYIKCIEYIFFFLALPGGMIVACSVGAMPPRESFHADQADHTGIEWVW